MDHDLHRQILDALERMDGRCLDNAEERELVAEGVLASLVGSLPASAVGPATNPESAPRTEPSFCDTKTG